MSRDADANLVRLDGQVLPFDGGGSRLVRQPPFSGVLRVTKTSMAEGGEPGGRGG